MGFEMEVYCTACDGMHPATVVDGATLVACPRIGRRIDDRIDDRTVLLRDVRRAAILIVGGLVTCKLCDGMGPTEMHEEGCMLRG